MANVCKKYFNMYKTIFLFCAENLMLFMNIYVHFNINCIKSHHIIFDTALTLRFDCEFDLKKLIIN